MCPLSWISWTLVAISSTSASMLVRNFIRMAAVLLGNRNSSAPLHTCRNHIYVCGPSWIRISFCDCRKVEIKDWIAAFEWPELGEATVNSESFKTNSWNHTWNRLYSCIFSHQPLPRFRVGNSPSVLLHLILQVTPWIMDVGTLLSFKVKEIFCQKLNNVHKTRISYAKKPGFKLGPRDYWATDSFSTPCLARAHCSTVYTWCILDVQLVHLALVTKGCCNIKWVSVCKTLRNIQ